MRLVRKNHFLEMQNPGDYTIADFNHPADRINNRKAVIILCPVCSGAFCCINHTIECEEPLTLSPSVVGPNEVTNAAHIKIPCGHHFFIKSGEVIL